MCGVKTYDVLGHKVSMSSDGKTIVAIRIDKVLTFTYDSVTNKWESHKVFLYLRTGRLLHLVLMATNLKASSASSSILLPQKNGCK